MKWQIGGNVEKNLNQESKIFSCIIPVKDTSDPKLEDLRRSIRVQDFPQDQIEILEITEGDSEQAKAIGIKLAEGKICAMFCSDNFLSDKNLFRKIYYAFRLEPGVSGVYTKFYSYIPKDNSLNRYFSLMGFNDPIPFYLGKCDRYSLCQYNKEDLYSLVAFPDEVPSLGDNGFFYRTDHIRDTNLDHYYPMDNAEDLRAQGLYYYVRLDEGGIWHRTTDGNLISFLIRRYRYARDLYCDRSDRRWRMFDGTRDYLNLWIFVLSALTIIPCLAVSLKGFIRVRDFAWFWHWPVCAGFLIMYSLLTIRTLWKRALSFRRLSDLNPLTPASKV